MPGNTPTKAKHFLKATLGVALLKFVTLGPFSRLMRRFTVDKIPIFMLHRFEDPTRGVSGFSPQVLREQLTYMRKKGIKFVSLEEVFRRFYGERSEPLENAVAFTIDDGFVDQVEIALPIFEEFRCPVTLFVVSGFIDGRLWPWADHVSYIFQSTTRDKIEFNAGVHKLSYELGSSQQKLSAKRAFREMCIHMPHDKRIAAVNALAVAADVEVPTDPPPQFAAVSWDRLRACESDIVTFGPHTVSHGIVSRMSKDEAEYEIRGSLGRLREELANPSDIFAWPNGHRVDFGLREMEVLSALGLSGAVSTEPAIADVRQTYRNPYNPYQIGRISMPDNLFDLIQYTSWVANTKWIIRPEQLRDMFAGRRHFAKYCLHRVLYKLGRYSGNFDIDWRRVKRFVFVCKGNICRSPYAAAKCRQLGIDATSAGLEATKSVPAHVSSGQNAEFRGVDLSMHQATHIDAIELSENDLVFCMTPRQLQAVKKLEGMNRAQITLLGLFSDVPAPYIPDPFGSTDHYFQRCFQMIDEAINRVVDSAQPAGKADVTQECNAA